MYRFILVGVILLLLSGAVAGTSYVHANEQRIAKINDSGVYYYHPDNLGSTSAVTDEAGEVEQTVSYLPFGEEFNSNPDSRFTGKEFDSDSGIYYFGARYYSPLTGRFLNSDPAQDGANWYSYANNNPLKFLDPTGREATTIHEFTAEELEEEYKGFDSKIKDPVVRTILSIVKTNNPDYEDSHLLGEVLREFMEGRKGSRFCEELSSFERGKGGETISITNHRTFTLGSIIGS